MASEQLILKQDGYLDVGCGSTDNAAAIKILARNIVYHPNLNVILVFDSSNQVKILDVHSGVILQNYQLAANDDKRNVNGRYMPLQDKILIWDGCALGFRGDYNGVLLLDTILQPATFQNDDTIKLELLLTEAIIFQVSLKSLEQEGLECPSDVSNELAEKIKKAESSVKKGIKAQRWNTICLELPYSSLKLVTNTVMIMLRRLERHIPALAIASAINERLTDLLAGARVPDANWHSSSLQRVLMHSEAVRRQTFEKWPHMDYKWALPDQMAQAGFYHQPSSSGEDRAMCFTCSVCLVCWEKTDEPWSEHERHSPMCPFVKGEYTQNVPLSVTYATNPALLAPGYADFDIISNSDYSNVLCTSCTQTGDITIWSIERQLRQMHTFNIATLMKDICDVDEGYEWARVTAICVLPNVRAQCKIKAMNGIHPGNNSTLGGIANVGGGSSGSAAPNSCGVQCSSTSTLRAGVVGSKIVLGLSIRKTTGEHLLRMAVLNIIASDRNINEINEQAVPNGVVSSGGSSLKSQSFTGSGVTAGTVNGAPSNTGAGDGSTTTENGANDKRDDNKSAKIFENFTDSFDTNGFALELMPFNQTEGNVTGGGNDSNDDKCNFTTQLEMLLDNELIKMDNMCEMSDIPQYMDKSQTSGMPGVHYGGYLSSAKLLALQKFKYNHENNANNNSLNNNNSSNIINSIAINGIANGVVNNNITNVHIDDGNNNNGSDNLLCDSKLRHVSDEIDCILQSCTIVKRMNALASCRGNSVEGESIDDSEIVEITEILPMDSECNQLIVKLMKTKAPKLEATQQIIMATTVEDLENEDEARDDHLNSEEVSAQLLVFNYIDSVISNEYTLALTFTRAKCPQQLCIVPNFQVGLQQLATNTDGKAQTRNIVADEKGALCVVCADGSIEIYSLHDFQLITVVEEEGEHFVSVAYCRSLDRLCGCTRNGILIFYSLNDVDNDSGDEMLDMEDENNLSMLCDQNSIFHNNEETNRGDSQTTVGVSVIDGGPTTNNSNSAKRKTTTTAVAANINAGEIEITTGPQLSIEGHGMNADISNLMIANMSQSSPSPSVASVNSSTVSTASLLAHKTADLTLEDLRMLYDLTQFDDALSPYTAEVPSCWNELVQAQKQRKQNMRDDTQFTKTWRLHNDATTWDEHVIELNLTQPVSLGHIDLKFQMLQPCQTLADVQVTLLKQNTSGFGYRMKPVNFNKKVVDDHMDMTLNNSEGLSENPVLSEEFLQAHNAEILVGPIEMSSCVDLSEVGGTVTLTSPKLFKTRRRNFMIHIKTMTDPGKESAGKARGWDGLHEISITVRGVKAQSLIANERQQRIAMLESNCLLDQLFRIISNEQNSTLCKNLALDILAWICFIRLNRFRSPKSERIKHQITKSTAASNTDLLAQQFECISLAEKYLENTMRYCIIRADRSMAHKCIKLMAILTNGIINLPAELQIQSTLDTAVTTAVTNTFYELPSARFASVVRWYSMLTSATSSPKSHNSISELCVEQLMSIAKEIDQRWDPYSALLGTRFGLYGFPFEPEIFDYDLPSVGKSSSALPSTLLNIIRTNAGVLSTSGMDIKKLCSIDGVDFRTFPHLIKCKSVSNQLRGLLEVEQLHFTCAATSEATRIDSMDNMATNSGSNISMDEIYWGPMFANFVDMPKDTEADKLNEVDVLKAMVSNFIGCTKKIKIKHKLPDMAEKSNEPAVEELNPNGDLSMMEALAATEKDNKAKCLTYTPVVYLEYCDEIAQKLTNTLNINSSSDSLGIPAASSSVNLVNTTQQQQQQQQAEAQVAQKQQNDNKQIQQQQPQQQQQEVDNTNVNITSVFAWHKLLTPPSKQMIVIDRMHSGARRFVVLDFGSPILLTDVVIPSYDELATLLIDIWCFDEETDCVRLVQASDIGSKTLVLSDLQPAPICRYMKITIIGRIGMSSSKCKIPIGSFFGHAIVLESDAYADQFLHYVRHTPHNMQAQIRALNALQEDVHCRYSLASCKLTELLLPILNCELSNVAHMQAFINKQNEEETNAIDTSKIVGMYEECILLQHQLNVIRNVIARLESTLLPAGAVHASFNIDTKQQLHLASRDKLRVLGQNLIEILLHFSFEYGIKNILPVHQLFTIDVANQLFNAFVVYGDAQIQLATCSLLVRMCCFQNWWGEFLADIFCNLYSSQNSKIFPQDRIFFLLTYLGRRSIAMGTCRSIVIDAILKTLAKLLAPISPRYQEASDFTKLNQSAAGGLWSKTDLQLITWLLLFLSACLDDNTDRKDKSANRWDFMSCESDFTKNRSNGNNGSGKQLRCLKRRVIQNKCNLQPYTDWGKKIFMIQNEHPGIFMELTGKSKPSTKTNKSTNTSASKSAASASTSSAGAAAKETAQDGDNNFEKGLRSLRLHNVLIVIRGLIALLLEMDFTCNMDQFLLTCKVIARLVSACKPAVQLSKIITTPQLEQLLRLAVWNDQQQPWAVHAITCLLQDLLDADKHFKDNDATPTNDGVIRLPLENATETREIMFNEYAPLYAGMFVSGPDMHYADGSKYSYLPSLIECEDTEFDELLNDIDLIERTTRPMSKKDSNAIGKNIFNYFCKSISSAMDGRLEVGLDWNVEVKLRWLTLDSTLHLYSSLPQILTNEFITTPPEATVWPEYITDIWAGPEYNTGPNTYRMFKNVFDCIFADLHLEDTWVHLEQVLQIWLTLNGELADKSYSAGLSQSDVPKIPFGANAVQGLLLALTWHNDIKLRTWCLGFQCLFLACNSQPIGEEDTDSTRIHEVIVNDENFEKMLLRFYSGYGISSSIISNRCAGLTICKHLHDLISLLHKKSKSHDGVICCKRQLKDTLLQVVLHLVQPGGAITNQHGPIDAQSHLVRDVLAMTNEKADTNVALNIIECVSFLVFNNISNSDKLQCQRTSDIHNSANAFSNLFANVLGSESSKQSTTISDNALLISLLKLCSSLIQTELPRQPSEASIPEEEELPNESQTDETKAEQLNIEAHRPKTPCIADSVLRHFPTMKRLLGSLSHCNSKSLSSSPSLYKVSNRVLQDEPLTTGDAVFNMLIMLCEKATSARLVVAPICKYLETSTLQRNALPRLQMSEPFLWFVSRVLEVPAAVQIFTQLGGIQIICQNLVRLNKVLLNMQPGLISLIMQHMTKNTKMKLNAHACATANGKKSTNNNANNNSSAVATQTRVIQDGLINFAPFCTVTPANDTAQSAESLVLNMASHRRPRTPAWSYMFYPNESHVTLNITLPTAILLKEVQLHPHVATLASCPSAVAVEVARDYGVGPVPVGPPLTTTGMTCIRLKLAKPEIATAIVLRLYRPKDNSSLGLSQLAILGNTIFAPSNVSNTLSGNVSGNNNNRNNINIDGLSANLVYNGGTTGLNSQYDSSNDEDAFAKTSIGWVRILSRCFSAASNLVDTKLSTDVIGASAAYPGFLEACCSLMNIMPMIPNVMQNHLEAVLLKFANYNCDLCLNLIRILLWNTTPQAYRLSNESICDLLYEMVTTRDAYTTEKVNVLLDWVMKLCKNFSNRTLRCNNPQSGFVKCIASILWNVHDEQLVPHLSEMITAELFDSCIYWIDALDNLEPLKISFDSILCALCHIKPEFFTKLLLKVDVHLQQQQQQEEELEDTVICNSATDDNKGLSGRDWFAHVAADNLNTLLKRPAYLSTLALACQSPLAIYQLVDSGLPKLLAYALYEYCWSLMPQQQAYNKEVQPTTSQATTSNNCLTDADKVAEHATKQTPQATSELEENSSTALLICAHVPNVLDFFSECCSEGLMRDWLGTQQGVIFWKPLLELLCNNRPLDFVAGSEPMQQAFVRIERATIKFFTRITACHPRNQDILTTLLIDVIRQPPANAYGSGKPTISGFTRQIVLQLLLENERILVSVHSKQPLLRKELNNMNLLNANAGNNNCNNNNNNNNNLLNAPLTSSSPVINSTIASSIPLASINHHPSKRVNAHHLMFYVSANTKCQEILQNCISAYSTNQSTPSIEMRVPEFDTPTSSIIPAMSVLRSNHAATLATIKQNNALSAAVANSINSEIKQAIEKAANNFGSTSTPLTDAFSDMSFNFSCLENGMEFLSVAAGVTAKDKRLKDVKNQVAAGKDTELIPNLTKCFNIEDFWLSSNGSSINNCVQLVHPDCPDVLLTSDTSISQLLAMLHSKGHSLNTPRITLNLVAQPLVDEYDEGVLKAGNMEPLPSPLQRFSSRGGLSLLAQYLPTVYPENVARKPSSAIPEKEKSPPMTDWVKLEPNDEIYEDLEDPISEPIAKHGTICSVPQHSLAAFGLLLRLPSYSDVLLRDKVRAQCLLRLVLGVTGDGEGNDIYSLSLASTLPTLPFEVFRQLLDSSPNTTDDGMFLRRLVIEVGAMHMVLNSLSVFTHQSQSNQIANVQNELPAGNKSAAATLDDASMLAASDDKSHMYWAKGTGFGTGSTAQSWNVEQALLRQKSEEEHVTVLLQVLSSYINPGDRIPAAFQLNSEYADVNEIIVASELPAQFPALLHQSCLLPALSSYLRNDSVLDITRHIPLYRAILQLLRALALSPLLVRMLQPQQSGDTLFSISELLTNMKTCVDTYAKRLKVNKKSNVKGQTQPVTVNVEDGDDEGLAMLIPDIHETTNLVQKILSAEALLQANVEGNGLLVNIERLPQSKSIEERYMEVMKKLQFDTYEMIVEADSNGYRFVVQHHFEKMVRIAGDRYHPSRVKRLAQEAVTLSTSLPLSYSSSVFVRCDTDRLDIMKVLITGPADTPYANGCFEFDVFFPPDYPNMPMLINLETTGRHSVRFNPNLYNDGKVCLSVLNTWHGRPEEKWNAQTSSFLQVLVSIQSLILVPEPYFNEPGFERSRGTPSGTQSSREYNSNIYQACVRWAMLEQIRNPSPCFKDVIHTHFWLKRTEICAQIENWIEELSKLHYTGRNNRTISFNSMVLRRQYRHLREEMAKLKVPEGLEDLDEPFNPYVNLPALSSETATVTVPNTTPAVYVNANNNEANSASGNNSQNGNNNKTQQQLQQEKREKEKQEIFAAFNAVIEEKKVLNNKSVEKHEEISQQLQQQQQQQPKDVKTNFHCPSNIELQMLSMPISPSVSSSSTSADSCSESAPMPMLISIDGLDNLDDTSDFATVDSNTTTSSMETTTKPTHYAINEDQYDD